MASKLSSAKPGGSILLWQLAQETTWRCFSSCCRNVVAPVKSSCDVDFIRAGAIVQGRVTRAEPGKPPGLALEMIDVDTSVGARPIPAAIRFVAVETNVPDAHSSYRTFVVHPTWAIGPSGPASRDRDHRLTFPEDALIGLELTEPVLVSRP